MGAWHTLHLFDHDKFINNVIPIFIDPNIEFRKDYFEFLATYRIGGIINLTQDELNYIYKATQASLNILCAQFDNDFRFHTQYNALNYNNILAYMQENEYVYQFSKFFEYIVFKYSADYFPHLPLGKHTHYILKEGTRNSFSDDLMYLLSDITSLYNVAGTGICGWLTKEETQLLYYDKEKHTLDDRFSILLSVAYDYGLGLVLGVDMSEEKLERLPQYNLISKEKWKNLNSVGLLFDRR